MSLLDAIWRVLAVLLLMGAGGLGAGDGGGAGSDQAQPQPQAQGEAQAQAPLRVMVLLPEQAGLPALRLIVSHLRETLHLGSERAIDLHVEAAEFSHFPSEHYDALLADFLAAKYQSLPEDHRPQVIVAVWSSAYRFFKHYRDILFPRVPLVFAGVDPRELDAIGPLPLSTGVITQADITGTLEAALVLQPSVQRALFILGSTPWEQRLLTPLRGVAEQFADRLAFDYLLGESPPRMGEVLSGLPSNTLVFFLNYFGDKAGNTYVPAEVLEDIAPFSAVPIYGIAETYLDRGLVGGHLYSPPRVGQMTGKLVLRLLQGESADAIAPVAAPNIWAFDARALERWGLSEAKLPPGSEVRFRPVNFWGEYRAYILAALVAVILQTLLIARLLHERRVRQRAEQRTQALGLKLITAQEEERAELARNLHDSVQQQLGVLAMNAAGLQQELARAGIHGPAPALLRERLVGLCGEVRAYAHRLHPPALDDLGLAEVLSDECARCTQALGIRVRLVINPALAAPPRTIGLTLYRIVQEALHNVAKHAGAHEVLVTLEPERGGLRLGIHDDGRGFAPGPATRPGLGLFTIRERLQAIGGTLQIDSTPGEGTSILVSVPLTEGHQP